MNDAKISVKPTWQKWKRIGEEREKRGGVGGDGRWSPPLGPDPFFCDSDPGYGIHGWTGKHRCGFKIITYHVSPQGKSCCCMALC